MQSYNALAAFNINRAVVTEDDLELARIALFIQEGAFHSPMQAVKALRREGMNLWTASKAVSQIIQEEYTGKDPYLQG